MHFGNLGRRFVREREGQSLVETAAFMVFMVLLIAYTVDFGYFFLVAANLTSASRIATEYAIEGYASPGQVVLPASGPGTATNSVTALALADMVGLLDSASTTTVQVCSKLLGINGNITNCASYGPSATSYSPDPDPEAPHFYLTRVDVTYQLQPPIPLSFFSVPLLPSLSFHRETSMRMTD